MRRVICSILFLSAQSLLASSINQQQFEAIGPIVEDELLPEILERSGYTTLDVNMNWDSEDISGGGAGARGQGQRLLAHVNGAMARHAVASADMLAFAICHELGHMIFTFPRIASEIDADIYAASICLQKLWTSRPEVTDAAEVHSDAVDIPPAVAEGCASSAMGPAMCVRIIRSLLSGARYRYEFIPGFDRPSLDTPATSGSATGKIQCMLDIGIASAMGHLLPACSRDMH